MNSSIASISSLSTTVTTEVDIAASLSSRCVISNSCEKNFNENTGMQQCDASMADVPSVGASIMDVEDIVMVTKDQL